MDNDIDPAKSTARSAEFSAGKPLPPIGGSKEEVDVKDDRSDKSNLDEDHTANTSSSAFDRPGEGSARPRIIRGFRPEALTDEEMEKEATRSVSFTNGQPETAKRRTYDGREITFVTLNTQTDWDWVEEAEASGTARTLTETGSIGGKEKGEISPRSASSKPDASEDKATPDVSQFLMPYNDEYGIPILDLSSDTDDNVFKGEKIKGKHVDPKAKYQRESEKHDILVDDPDLRIDVSAYDKDDTGMTHGMFSGVCEFCQHPIKPFPTVEQQLKTPPEDLYCCNDYREFVEYVLSTSTEMEEEQKRKNKLIDIKPHEHVGSKQERNAAKEKAVQRMRERELQRRQQEASGLQQNFFALNGSKTGLGNLTMKDMYVARQMKTINYQLSSQKCLEEGWTLRAPSPLMDDLGDDVFTPEPLHPDMIADGKLRERPLIEKFYESGKKFLTMFPDGTGNVFYPSGNLAILISSVKLGQYYYTIHQDAKRSGVAAAFEPNGYGYCYFPNGDNRLYIDQYGGLELDNFGARRRKWSWKDQVTHVHAPPFQPICIGINRHMGVRVMSQENIALTFSASKRSCRFNMGSRLKLVAPENAPLKEVEEEYIFLEEKKNHVDALLNKVANLLKFPNNPKLDKMLPPLHITSKQTKTEKMKKDRQIFLAQQSARDKKQPSITVTS